MTRLQTHAPVFKQGCLFEHHNQATPQEVGLTDSVRAFLATLEQRLPAGSLCLLERPDTVLVMHTDAQLRTTRVEAYKSLPALGEYVLINVGIDWVFTKKYWFRKRLNHTSLSPQELKYELLISYTEAYRPEFEVDLTSPLFSLTL